ncbi:hypothetical protein Sjap_021700 [Stephania japonica]|uniref:Protein kinase domain-containing protein n=1 Tax=Stephania japonica TaxID=461633 RepID=A0AAP0EUM9_9MAGN
MSVDDGFLRTITMASPKSDADGPPDGGGGEGGAVVVVGLKLDQQSRELLTWALMKVAQSGDRVVALHVVPNTDKSSSLLSLVKAFDSVLAVYEGFCNLKQVDLKLKICRGSSIRKVFVREAKSYSASKVVVGTAKNHAGIGFSFNSVAKYCARKLSKSCAVLAVNNGKVVFSRDWTKSNSTAIVPRGTCYRPRKNLFSSIHRTISKSHRAPTKCDQKSSKGYTKEELSAISGFSQTGVKQKCPICQTDKGVVVNSRAQQAEEKSDDGGDANSLALVPLQRLEAASSSVSLLIRELPELRPGCPLVSRAILPNSHALTTKPVVKEVSVVQWAMRLPSRYCSSSVHPDHQCSSSCSDQSEDDSSKLDGESGAIVPVGIDHTSPPLSPDHGPLKLPKELESLHEKYSSTCRLFGYQELLFATSNFAPEMLIGRGGSSKVYKGCLPDGKELAVKILEPSHEDAVKEFVLEIEIITALNHKNIVSLFGFCMEDSNLLLVYDFLSRGSLERNLHGDEKNKATFGWNERYNVALGVAEALDYLHSDSTQPVIHRDVKSSNILLSEDFEPQLSDFGLAKWASTSVPHVACDDVAGTFGYLAPEYFMYGNVDDKVDVYAFGVVLLELLSGRKPISNEYPKGQESLVMWAKPILNSGKFVQLLDPSLGDNYDSDEIDRMVVAATLCIRRSPRSRPQMNLVSHFPPSISNTFMNLIVVCKQSSSYYHQQVLKLLQGDVEVTKWCREQIVSSDDLDGLEDESSFVAKIQSHLNLALLDVDSDSTSVSSTEQSISVEEYLRGRWSRSSSFA